MNFGSLIGLATQNKIESSNTKVKGFSATVSPAVKPIRSNVPSPNIQAFLAKQEKEKREKDREFKKQKEHLLALRAQNSKNNKKAKIMASRTKDNDFSRIRLTEDQVEAKGKREAEIQRKMLTDKVERMKARIHLEEQEALLPHKRKRKRKTEASDNSNAAYQKEDGSYHVNKEAKKYRDDRDEKARSIDNFNSVPAKDRGPPVKKKKNQPPSQPLNFQELLKVAAEKQQQSEESASEDESDDEEDTRNRRPMTKKDLERHRELEMRRKGISVNNNAAARGSAANGKRSGPNKNQVNNNVSKMNGNVKSGLPVSRNNSQYPPQSRMPEDRIPKISQGQQMQKKGGRFENNRNSGANEIERNFSSQYQQDVRRTSHGVTASGSDRGKSFSSKNVTNNLKKPSVSSQNLSMSSRPTSNRPGQQSQYSERSPKQRQSVHPSNVKGYPQDRTKRFQNQTSEYDEDYEEDSKHEVKRKPPVHPPNMKGRLPDRPKHFQNQTADYDNGYYEDSEPETRQKHSVRSLHSKGLPENRTKRFSNPSPVKTEDYDDCYENNQDYSVRRKQAHPSKGFLENRVKERDENNRKSEGFSGVGRKTKEQPMRERNPFTGNPKRLPNNNEAAFRGQNTKVNPNFAGRDRFSDSQKQREYNEDVRNSNKHQAMPKSVQRSLPSKSEAARVSSHSSSPSPSAKASSAKPQMKLSNRPQHQEPIQRGGPMKERPNPVSKRPPNSSDGNRMQSRLPPIGRKEPVEDRPKPKLPPIGQIRNRIMGPRNPYGRLPSKISRQYYESEDEDDDDMNDFIDDGNNDECNEDYSKYIRDIFGYDKRRYVFEDDDDIIETTFAEQMKEEARSARIGLLEDLEDIRQEEEEKKKASMMMKRGSKSTK